MISWLKGRVVHIEGWEVTLEVNGVGYCLLVGPVTQREMGLEPEAEAQFAVHMAVKEDDIRLYGFPDFHGRRLFHLLLGVNGVGPKAASSILDQLKPSLVVRSIAQGDHVPFTQVSGIGKKTAQRIVLDLQGKMEQESLLLGLQGRLVPAEGMAPATAGGNHWEDAKSALKNLGFMEKEIERVLSKHRGSELSLDQLIKLSLAELVKK